MEISFEGSPKEIAALLVKLQGRTGNVLRLSGSINDEELKKLLNKDEPQRFHIITEDDIPRPFLGDMQSYGFDHHHKGESQQFYQLTEDDIPGPLVGEGIFYGT